MAKKNHGHHGGAWKVAYADFVTAMMALFLVLWLTSQDQKIKEAVQRSFRNPVRPLLSEGSGIMPNPGPPPEQKGGANDNAAAAVELNVLRKMANDLTKSLPANPDPSDEETLRLELTPEGVRVNVFDRSRRPVFEPDSAEFTRYGEWVVTTLAWSISRLEGAFNVEIEGHTERGRPKRSEMYGKWELSADRANSARRKLLEHGVTERQIRKVAGFADVNPLANSEPESEINRRVTVMLKINSASNL